MKYSNKQIIPGEQWVSLMRDGRTNALKEELRQQMRRYAWEQHSEVLFDVSVDVAYNELLGWVELTAHAQS